MAFVELRGINKLYGQTHVVHDVHAEFEQHEFVVILGPSGCGKSTLLRMIAGLEEVSSGEIHIAGRRVDTVAPKDRGCAMVFQNYALYPHLSVSGNIGYGLRVAGMPKKERQAKILEVSSMLRIDHLLDRKPGHLSGGQRQRVAIARAIAREPRVFLFDEPLSNLDAKLRTAMRSELRKLHDRIGATSIYRDPRSGGGDDAGGQDRGRQSGPNRASRITSRHLSRAPRHDSWPTSSAPPRSTSSMRRSSPMESRP